MLDYLPDYRQLNLMAGFITLCLLIFSCLALPIRAAEYYAVQLERSFPFGEYFATIYVGNPPQAQSVVIDNYQKMLVLNCKDCLSCHASQRHESYRYNKSLSSREVECKDQIAPCSAFCSRKPSSETCKIENGDYFGRYSVKMVSDEIRLEENAEGDAAKPYYGCVVSENLARSYDENGILGIAFSESNIFNSLFQLSSNDYVKQVGVCLSAESGYLEVGMIPNWERQSYASLPMASDNLYGIAGVEDILFGEMSIKQDYSLKSGGIFVMTRLPYTILPGRVFAQIRDKLKLACFNNSCEVELAWQEQHRQNMTCISFEEEVDLDDFFPPLEFRFEGYNFSWSASQYLVPGVPSTASNTTDQSIGAYYCLTFMNSSKIDKYALGINFLQNRHIVFDVASSTILVRDNYDCALRRPAQVKPIMQYFLFVVLTILLFGRRYAIRMVRRCRFGLGEKAVLHQEHSQKNKAELNQEFEKSGPELK